MKDLAASRTCTLGIVSDIHYAGPGEQARGNAYEHAGLRNPLLRFGLRWYRDLVWLRNPLNHGYLLDRFLDQSSGMQFAVANGDFSCDSGFVGVSDDAACASAKECLGKLRRRFGENFQGTIGDHELGKMSFAGGRGGMRLKSFERSVSDLGLESCWKVRLGKYVFVGVTSSLIALPYMLPDILPQELAEWERLRQEHLEKIRETLEDLGKGERLLLFCHDPSALPFLAEEEWMRSKWEFLERTIIGHLHSPLVLMQSRVLAGMPSINFLGTTARRMTRALNRARLWRPFKVLLCPSLTGVELRKDGGYYTAELDLEGSTPARFQFHAMKR